MKNQINSTILCALETLLNRRPEAAFDIFKRFYHESCGVVLETKRSFVSPEPGLLKSAKNSR